jgi:hypothetical protein
MDLEVVVSYHSNEDYATIFFREPSKGIGTISMPAEGTSMEVSREFAINLYMDFRTRDSKLDDKQRLLTKWIEFVKQHKAMLDILNK